MGRIEEWVERLEVPIAAYLRNADDSDVRKLILQHSNLPGARANLELAAGFAKALRRLSALDQSKAWKLCEKWASLSPDLAPANRPEEFLVFCGIRGLGGIASVESDRLPRLFPTLHALAADRRWRIREAVAMAIQELLSNGRTQVRPTLETWVRPGAWLEMRAVAAGLAEPPLLKDPELAARALEIHRRILAMVTSSEERTSDAFKILRQALGYTVSVIVAARPEEGFSWLQEVASSTDADVRWIVRENLKKKRLLEDHPKETSTIARRMPR